MKKKQILFITGLILTLIIFYSCQKASKSPSDAMWAYTGGISEDLSVLPVEIEFAGESLTEEFDPRNFDHIVDNPFLHAGDYPLSTFSVDVDTASYSIMRGFFNNDRMPPASSVRIEELLNYFDYDYFAPTDGKPFTAHTEVAKAPWNPDNLLARIAIKGKEFPEAERPKVNLVFLIDVSGSMEGRGRLPLLLDAMELLVNELNGTDRVAICVYAGNAGTVLPPTNCDEKQKIIGALKKLKAGGSTAGGEGIELAYKLAKENFDPGAINRVILCTDGDFNVGMTNRGDLINLITEKAKSGVYLTILGFGMSNFQDGTMKQLASKGNGNYGYIDTIQEAQKILVKQLSGTLVTIAQDVKIQVEFNPANVGAYRLIGYENRLMRDEDFSDDTKDAGDIGAGHTVTAFYEIIPPGKTADELPRRDQLKYGKPDINYEPEFADELLTVKIRYKLPGEEKSELINSPVLLSSVKKTGNESQEFRFASSVAGFGMLLRNSKYKGNASYADIISMAENSAGKDTWGLRNEFISLVKKAESLSKK